MCEQVGNHERAIRVPADCNPAAFSNAAPDHFINRRFGVGNQLGQVRIVGLLAVVADNPFQTPPPFEKLVGDLAGAYSRRINIQHRLVYQVLHAEHTVKVLRMWTHYE